jgi:hypothetical protein
LNDTIVFTGEEV